MQYAHEQHVQLLMAPALIGVLFSLKGPRIILPMLFSASLILPLSNTDWMAHSRFFVVSSVLGVTLVGVGLQGIIDLARRHSKVVLSLPVAVCVGLFLLAATTFANNQATLNDDIAKTDFAGYITQNEIRRDFQPFYSLGHEVGVADALYMTPDMGSTSFDSNARMLDLGGLTDTTLPREQTPASVQAYLLEERQPDFVRAHEPWIAPKFIDRLPWLTNGYIGAAPVPNDFAGGSGVMYIKKSLFVSSTNIPERKETGVEVQSVSSPEMALSSVEVPLDIYASGSTTDRAAFYEVTVSDNSGAVVQNTTGELGYTWYPSTSWQAGEQIRQRVWLTPVPEGTYRVDVAVNDQPVSSLRIDRSTNQQLRDC